MWSPIHSLHHFHPVKSTSSTCPLRALELVMHLLCFILFPHNNHILHMVRGIVTGLWGKAPTHATAYPWKHLLLEEFYIVPLRKWSDFCTNTSSLVLLTWAYSMSVLCCLLSTGGSGPSLLQTSQRPPWLWSSEILALGRGFLQGSKVVYLPLSLHLLDAGAHVQYLHKERTWPLKGHRCVYPEK